jgi:cytochrome c-type biogenesis protein CcmH/NrfG
MAEMKALPDDKLVEIISATNESTEQKNLANRELQKRDRATLHELNLQILEKQKEANKAFLHITVKATIGAAILGAVVGGLVQFGTQVYFQKQSQQKPQQILQNQNNSPTSASHSEKTTDKVPSPPPSK